MEDAVIVDDVSDNSLPSSSISSSEFKKQYTRHTVNLTKLAQLYYRNTLQFKLTEQMSDMYELNDHLNFRKMLLFSYFVLQTDTCVYLCIYVFICVCMYIIDG